MFKKVILSPSIILASVISLLYLSGYLDHLGYITEFGASEHLFSIGFYEAITNGFLMLLAPMYFFSFIPLFVLVITALLLWVFEYLDITFNGWQETQEVKEPNHSESNKTRQFKEKLSQANSMAFKFIIFYTVSILALFVFVYFSFKNGSCRALDLKNEFKASEISSLEDYPAKSIKFTVDKETVMGIIIDRSKDHTLIYDGSEVKFLINSEIKSNDLIN